MSDGHSANQQSHLAKDFPRKTSEWAVGDWIIEKLGKHPADDVFAVAEDLTPWNRETLSNYALICRSFAPEDRFMELKFTFHQSVYKLPRHGRQSLLERALREHWDRDTLRRQSAIWKRTNPASVAAVTPWVEDAEQLHSKIQWYLLTMGQEAGCQLWVAVNDRSGGWQGRRFDEAFPLVDSLPQLDPGNRDAESTVERIDVIWLQRGAIRSAFEIENTTGVYSGLLRFADLVTLVPHVNIPLWIVAPKKKLRQALIQSNRPVFTDPDSNLQLDERARFIKAETLFKEVENFGGRIAHMNWLKYLNSVSEPLSLPTGADRIPDD